MLRGASCRFAPVAAAAAAAILADGSALAADKKAGQHRRPTTEIAATALLRLDPGSPANRGTIAPERGVAPALLRPAPNAGIAPVAATREMFHWSGTSRPGPSYQVSPGWSLYAGIPDESREPGAARRKPGAGLGYRPNDSWNVEFGIVRSYNDGLRGVEPVAPGGSLISKPGTTHELLGLSGRLRF